MTVNGLMIELSHDTGNEAYRDGFTTDPDVGQKDVSQKNVAELASAGRARWKIENEMSRKPQATTSNTILVAATSIWRRD
jgi:hypothetical protein